MTTTQKTQIRGICQCCGREQAVVSCQLMSKHGYTVDHGWFSGVCRGQNYKPMQLDRSEADAICAQVARDCAKLEERAAGLRAGTILPLTASSYKRDEKGNAIEVPFAEAHSWHQRSAVEMAIFSAEERARMGRSFVAELQQRAATFHGQPLRAVPVEAGPAPIERGERRQSIRSVLICTGVRGARVEWKDDRGYRGWTGTQAWRRLPMAAAEVAQA